MSSPSTGIGWGVSWSQVVVGFCRTPSLQCGIFPTLGDIAYSGGHYWWSKRSATCDGEYPAMLELVHNVWNSSRPVVQHCPHCEMTVWNNLMSDFCHIKVKHLTIRNCQLWWKMWCLKQFFYKLLIDTNIWFVVSQNVRLIKCSAGMACSLISLRATDTTMERGDFFCPILIILQTNYSQIPRLLSKLGLTGAWNALKKYSQNGKGCQWKNVNWKFG